MALIFNPFRCVPLDPFKDLSISPPQANARQTPLWLPLGLNWRRSVMAAVELFPADIYNQKTISQGHPPGWTNGEGGEFDLIVLGGGPAGLVSVLTAAASGRHVRKGLRRPATSRS